MKQVLLLSIMLLTTALAFASDDFEWRNATVYFVITDRFLDGDSANNINYGRKVDYGSDQMNAATFHGGDIKGLTQKAREGYFQDLGVDAVWMTDVYEQIHGWMTGSGSVNDFPHYGYHGYYPLDYTQMDKNYGTIDEMRELVNVLHSQGIRVLLGANLNNPGYPTLLDAVQYGFAPADGLSQEAAADHNPKWSYDRWAQYQNWPLWWTSEWIRTPDENWDQTDPLTTTLYGLPDFKDEKIQDVNVPQFLKDKWEMEGSLNDAWVNPSSIPLRKDSAWAPADYVINWIAAWVEEFGIDGFRCDIVEYVHLPRWRQLNEACNEGLNRWRKRHPDDPASQWAAPFYMTGDFDFASIDYKKDYADAGFSSMVNYYFPKHGDLDAIVPLWQAYSDSMMAHPNWHPFNYLNNSYHREADPDNMIDCGTTLLSPGVAQIFYGDETGRKPNPGAMLNVDSDQAFRGDMNWDSIDSLALAHYQRLGQIRKEYPAIASGRQFSIDSHTCARVNKDEILIIRVKPNPVRGINVGAFFPDGIVLEELYTRQSSIVKDGHISFSCYQNNIAVLAVPK